ncbi:MAG: hypothetical protein HY548_00155 [Elusimicrobia bacterium]|nr:hypothetical protein [Elusimicrobiota bacterium]
MTESLTKMAPWAWVSRDHPQHTETILDWVLRENVQRLVVWGGDGTFHRVVKGLWKRNALNRLELALVPTGTCNDLARRYQLSKYFWRRWEAAVPEGRLASLSLGHMAWSSGEDIFINNAGIGRSPTPSTTKEGAWNALKSFQPIRFTARWADGQMQGICYMALFCNAPFFSGGLFFEKEISPEEGLLRLYFVPARSKARLAFRLLWGRLGFPLFDSKLSKLSVTKIALETETPVWPQADGEPPPEMGVPRLELKILPEKVRLWVP